MNPFGLAYEGLWKVVESNSYLVELINPGNRIKFDERRGMKDGISDADLPELALLPDGGAFNLRRSTCEIRLTRAYNWVVVTGDFRVNQSYNTITWELFVAMHNWEEILRSLLWRGCPFIQDCILTSCDEGISMSDLERGIRGWTGLWKVELHMQFHLQNIKGCD